MNKYENLLYEWCDYLVKNQDESGGFGCEACGFDHGRADNAVYPLIYIFTKTAEPRFLLAARRVMAFRRLLTCPDGAVQNDFQSEWKGITVFSAIGLYKTIRNFGARLPDDFRNELTVAFTRSAEWVSDNIDIGFRANINYYAAASAVNAMRYEYSGDEGCREKAARLLEYCLSHISHGGILCGEAQPHSLLSPKGCVSADIGYNIEESLPCLFEAAELINDREASAKIRELAKVSLDFILPDGGLDNSFGLRNNKWTYYGSRTADGPAGVFTSLGKNDPVFYAAAKNNLDLLERCTVGGALGGGLSYSAAGEPPCVHHTICHACSLTDALLCGFDVSSAEAVFSAPESGDSLKYYPELDTYIVNCGAWRATVTGYDFTTYTYENGAAHCSGGTLSLLYGRRSGPVIAGSVYDYRLTEKNNMQTPCGKFPHRPLIPRAEYESEGKKYATCLDGEAKITAEQGESSIIFKVRAGFKCIGGKEHCPSAAFADFEYIFTPDKVIITLNVCGDGVNAKFILPVISGSAGVITGAAYKKEKIFFLTGGLIADEYTFDASKKLTVTITE